MKEQFVEEYREAGIRLKKNIPFGIVDGFTLLLDIIYCEDVFRVRHPAIVWIHGGAWSDHNLDRNYRPEIEIIKMAEKGYIVFCIDYRLSDEAPFPAQIQDCKCAIRYIRAHAEEWNIDTEKIGVWGESAGGQLVALLGTTANCKEFEGNAGWGEYSSHVNAVCEWYGPNDMTLKFDKNNNIIMQLIGKTMDSLEESLEKLSPIYYVNENVPPFLIMHGSADQLVPIVQSEIMVKTLKEKSNNPVEYFIVPDQGHGFFTGEEAYKIVNDFFDKYLF